MYNKRGLPFALAALVVTGDAAALANAKVTLQQATATAEQQTSSRAVSADIKQIRGATRIEVEVVGPQGLRTVVVTPSPAR